MTALTLVEETPSPTRPRYLSVKQVAELFGVSILTVYRWIQLGEVPVVKIGRTQRIDMLVLEKRLAAQTSAGAGDHQ